MKKRIVVIGGGMAGCAAAYALCRKGYRVTIVERNDYLGGRIRSVVQGQASFELGAGFMTDVYTNVFRFLQGKQLNNALHRRKTRTSIVRNGKLQPMTVTNLITHGQPLSRSGSLNLLRTVPGVLSRLIQFDVHQLWNVQSAAAELRPMSKMVTGKYGQEVVDYFWQPIVDAYCYWSVARTSEQAVLWITKLIAGKTYAMSGGLQRIPELAAQGSNVMPGSRVKSVRKAKRGYSISVIGPDGSQQLTADGVVCAVPATVVPSIITGLNHEQRDFFTSVTYSATALLARTYELQGDAPQNQAWGYARREGGPLAAITVTTENNVTVVKAYASGAMGPSFCRMDDSDLTAALSDATPQAAQFGHIVSQHLQRWPEAIPEFSVEHVLQLKKIANGELTIDSAGITYAGDYLMGPFIEGAFTTGIQAAERLHRQLSA